MTVFGWDASDFDWGRRGMAFDTFDRARREGIRFFTHKATEGTRTKHLGLASAIANARRAGIDLVGAYVVVRTPGNGGHGGIDAQAQYLINYVDTAVPDWRELPGWFWQVDLEHWSENGQVYDAVAPGLGVAMAGSLRSLTRKQIVLYAPQWAYGNTIAGQDPLWASSYVNGTGTVTDLYPGDSSPRWGAYSGRTPTFLQFSSRATIGGQPQCDANAFRGSYDQLRSLIMGDGMLDGYNAAGYPDKVTRSEGTAIMETWEMLAHGKTLQGGGTAVSDLAKALQAVLDNGKAQLAVLQQIETLLGELQTGGIDPAKVAAALQDPLLAELGRRVARPSDQG